ncbi:hypothetical protein BU15DRAFT_61487 [Melanogaster broomeanus]|nr:hypothetical protein BU15DRAFT_61487 [Melanogaster broomeanus]
MTCTRTNKVKKVWPQLSDAQKTRRHVKFDELTKDVNCARLGYLGEVQALSKKHGRSERWMRWQLYLGSSTVAGCRALNTWNAFVRQSEACAQQNANLFRSNGPRGGIEDLSGPKLFFSEKAEKFVCSVLDLEPRHLALKLEAFVVAGLDAILREDKITNNVKMNYNNYERAIVECYVRNPGSLGGHAQVQVLLNALINKMCQWTKLTDNELSKRVTSNLSHHEAGEAIYKPRKKHTSRVMVRSTSTIDSSDEEVEED